MLLGSHPGAMAFDFRKAFPVGPNPILLNSLPACYSTSPSNLFGMFIFHHKLPNRWGQLGLQEPSNKTVRTTFAKPTGSVPQTQLSMQKRCQLRGFSWLCPCVEILPPRILVDFSRFWFSLVRAFECLRIIQLQEIALKLIFRELRQLFEEGSVEKTKKIS